jgi:hypothetical protein
MDKSRKSPTIFISYSWGPKEHQDWVLEISKIIAKNGAEVILDKTHMKFGTHMKTFMIKSVQDADIVLMILTPEYKSKADGLLGGAGYEYNLISDEMYKVAKSNTKFIPVLRKGDPSTSLTNFLSGFRYVDLREGSDYSNNLEELMNQISAIRSTSDTSRVPNKPTEMELEYQDISQLSKEMMTKAHSYFNELLVPKDERFAKAKLQAVIVDWEHQIEKYSKDITEKFNPQKMILYQRHVEDFKNNIFAKHLWTVSSALRTRDPELAKYKGHYRDADASEIFDTVNGILEASHEYVKQTGSRLDYSKLGSLEDLKLDYLDEEEMSLKKIIGFGIRSEILHRYYPSYFPIMTQKNLWAMYFICESSNEFIRIETKVKKGASRVSHNWQYPYDRFIYLMTILGNAFQDWLLKVGIKTNPAYRFGYMNLFLYEIHDHRISDIKLLHEWADLAKHGKSSK